MLNPYLLVVVALVAYAMAVDDYVAPFILLQFKRLGLNTRRAIWMIRMHPRAPWTRYSINRRAWRLAEEMRNSFSLPTEDRK
jgi:hypothetical protein